MSKNIPVHILSLSQNLATHNSPQLHRCKKSMTPLGKKEHMIRNRKHSDINGRKMNHFMVKNRVSSSCQRYKDGIKYEGFQSVILRRRAGAKKQYEDKLRIKKEGSNKAEMSSSIRIPNYFPVRTMLKNKTKTSEKKNYRFNFSHSQKFQKSLLQKISKYVFPQSELEYHRNLAFARKQIHPELSPWPANKSDKELYF